LPAVVSRMPRLLRWTRTASRCCSSARSALWPRAGRSRVGAQLPGCCRHPAKLSQVHGDSPWSGVLEHAFQSAGLALPASATKCDSHAIKVALLASTDALGLLGKPMLTEPPVAALLQEIPLDKPFPLLTCSLYTRATAGAGRRVGRWLLHSPGRAGTCCAHRMNHPPWTDANDVRFRPERTCATVC
jgi:hypothetical protein